MKKAMKKADLHYQYMHEMRLLIGLARTNPVLARVLSIDVNNKARRDGLL